MTTYRVYLNTINATDYLSSCSGEQANPLVFTSSSGSWYNDPASTTWNALGINSAFLNFFPDLAYDSFLTIGAEDASVPAAQHPSSVWGTFDATSEFTGGPGSSFVVDDATGGAWYTPFPGVAAAATHAGFAGDDLRILVAQFTTEGTMSGQIQIQVFIEGNQNQEFRDLLPLCATGTCGGCTDSMAMNFNPDAFYDDGSCEYDPNGCLDATACNYAPNASVDDGSCQYDDALGVCGGDCAVDADMDGICDDEDECVGTFEECNVFGCMDFYACNYNEDATVDDGTCESESCQWCNDVAACNYEGEGLPWTANGDLCVYIAEGDCDCAGNQLDATGECGGDCEADDDQDGVCDDVDGCIGAVDACGVCNGPGAIYDCGCFAIPEGQCDCDGTQVDAAGVCGGNCAVDADGDGWCDECVNTPVEGYALETEVVTVHTTGSLAGLTTYRLYMKCANAADYVNACAGDDENPLVLSASSGSWFNHPGNTSFNAIGVSPDLFVQFPTLEYDSYLTIGASSSNTPSSQHPSSAWGDVDASLEFDGNGSGFNVTVDDATGGIWYSPFPGLEEADSHPGFAGDDLRVLLMQMTTSGSISGQIQVQIFQNGDQDEEVREVFLYDSEYLTTDCENLDPCDGIIDACGVCQGPGAIFECGCTVLPAGDCDCDGNQLDALGVCGGTCIQDADGNGECDLYSEGCTDNAACNYVNAVSDDDSCIYPEEHYGCDGECLADTDGDGVCDPLEIAGCTDDAACNYNSDATDDDGTCAVIDECGICGGGGYLGCIDLDACNYDENASCDDGSCVYAETLYDCAGVCLNDADGDGVCNELEVNGCTDASACNYAAEATEEDGTCEYAEADYDCDGNCLNDADGDLVCDELEVEGCTDGVACNYSEEATENDGTCEYAVEYYNCDGTCISDSDDDGVCDELEVDGCTDDIACNFSAEATDDDGSCSYAETNYDCDGNCLNDEDGDLVCDELEVGGCTDATACNYNEEATDEDDSCTYPEAAYECDGTCSNDEDGDGVCDEFEIPGCDVEGACNYDAAATDNDGSCEFAETYYDCDGVCLIDLDQDGVCDELEISGCTYSEACNYNEDATNDNGSCTYPEPLYDCDGNCLNDADGDAVCDEFEVPGCDDSAACNFEPEATDNDGSCQYPYTYYDCDGNCLGDADGDLICDELEIAGCTYGDACNFNAEATDDDGSCVYAETYYDCDGNCLNDADGDLVCDELEVDGCTDEAACNYSAEATEDDGSCLYPGDTCDDNDDSTINDVYSDDCVCAGEVDGLTEAESTLDWGVYPSPTFGALNLRLEGAAWGGDVEAVISSATGQALRLERLAGPTQLDVHELAPGVYFLTLRSPAMAATTRRFVVGGE